MTPIPESQDVLQRDGVPDNIKSFYKFNHIWRFRYDRPFHKGTKDKENEFKVGQEKQPPRGLSTLRVEEDGIPSVSNAVSWASIGLFLVRSPLWL